MAKRVYEGTAHPEHYSRLQEISVRKNWTCFFSMKPFKWTLNFKFFILAFAFAKPTAVFINFPCLLLLCIPQPEQKHHLVWPDLPHFSSNFFFLLFPYQLPFKKGHRYLKSKRHYKWTSLGISFPIQLYFVRGNSKNCFTDIFSRKIYLPWRL